MDRLIEAVCAGIKEMLQFSLGTYNNFAGKAAGMLGENPAAWNSGGWKFAEGANAVFTGTAAVLVVIFFLIGFCSESLDVKQELRFESIIRMFLKISIAEFFTVNSLKIVKKLFSLGTGFISALSGKGITFSYSMPADVSEILNEPGNNGISGWSGLILAIVAIILAVVFMLITAGCGMMILYEAFSRFFKILLLVPYGTLANSTLAGNHTLSHSAVSFWKYALCTIMEAVTMYMALALSASVLNSGAISLRSGNTGVTYIIAWIMESTFICMMTLGMVKGAETITQKALGL
ncbi:MAG: hypothetical protein ACI4AD_05665 [Roseburia sp.]